MVIHRGVFENNQIALVLSFTFIPKTGIFLYCAERQKVGYRGEKLFNPKI